MNPEAKPYLKEVYDLYKKICEFETAVDLKYSYHPGEEAHCYVNEDIDSVIDGLSKGLLFTPGELNELRDAMRSGKINFIRLNSDKEAMSEDEFQLLYIISRPFYRSMRNVMNLDNIYWKDGRCPVCREAPSLSTIEKESQRKYHCSFCGTQGYYMRVGCPNCLTENAQDITIITLEGEEGIRADMCEKCKSYVKTFENDLILYHSLDLLDIVSIPVDIVVQDMGFIRHSPNPVGLIRMS